MNNKKIFHEGVVSRIDSHQIEVKIEAHEACGRCHAKGACGLSSVQDKRIMADLPAFEVKEGDAVWVYGTLRNAMFSVFLSYILPTIVIIAGVMLFSMWMSEATAALCTFALLILYLFFLYLGKGRLGRQIRFSIMKRTEEVTPVE